MHLVVTETKGCTNLKNDYTLQLSETPITFVKELTDAEIDEESTLTLTCETSKPKVDVKWFRDDKEIKVTDKRAKFSKKDAVHTLTIEKVTKDDQAKYSCQIVKNKVKTEGKVTTKGIYCGLEKQWHDQRFSLNCISFGM